MENKLSDFEVIGKLGIKVLQLKDKEHIPLYIR